MVDRNAIASGFSLSEIGTATGSGAKTAGVVGSEAVAPPVRLVGDGDEAGGTMGCDGAPLDVEAFWTGAR